MRRFAFDAEQRRGLRVAIADLGLQGRRLAVRSSAVDEDGARTARAGAYDSVLNVSEADLEDAIRTVWASAWAGRTPGQPAPAMAVVVQAFVDAEVSAVAFGADPVTGDRGTRVIEAVIGLGEGVVRGTVPADRWTVTGSCPRPPSLPPEVPTLVGRRDEPADLRIVADITDKDAAVEPATEGGTRRRPVRDARRAAPALSDARVREIVAMVDALGAQLGGPQDTELAIAGGKLWLLQARPVTALPSHPRSADPLPVGAARVWDASNLRDNYPGLASPLTASFVRWAYERGSRGLLALLGVPRREIDANAERYAHLVASIRGRLYYDLGAVADVFRQLPFPALTIPAFHQAIGAEPPDSVPSDTGGPLRIARTLAHLALRLAWLGPERAACRDAIRAALDAAEAVDYDALPAREIARVYRALEEAVVDRWRAPPLNGLLCMLAFAGTRRATRAWGLDRDHPGLLGELVAGENVRSVRLVDAIGDLADHVCRDPALLARFAVTPDDDAIGLGAEFPAFGAAVDAYLREYGERAAGGELKLETPTARDRPGLLFRAVRARLRVAGRATGSSAERRTAAEAIVAERLAGWPVHRIAFFALLSVTRALLAWREEFRLLRARAFAQTRRAYAAIGRRLAADGVLRAADDVYWLETHEIGALVDGSSAGPTPTAARRRVAERRDAHARWQGEELPIRVRFAGSPEGYAPPRVVVGAGVPAGAASIVGVGCCAGRVRGRVRVVTSADQLGDFGGDVVVAANADPGWVPYFPTAAGVVLERGSLLGHVAIATRELGIPCVIGAAGVVSMVREGDLVELDGATGEVRRCEAARAAG